MRKRRIISYGAGLLGMAGIAAILYFTFVPRISIEQVRSTLEESLPIGTSKVRAKSWLQSQSSMRFQGEVVDAMTDQVTGLSAEIADSGPRWDSSQRIEILFFFDDEKLSRIHVERHITPFVFPK